MKDIPAVTKQIKIIEAAQNELLKMGYMFDFVDEKICIVHRDSLGREMAKCFDEIDTDNYVYHSF